MAKTGYINGSDLLVKVAGNAVGHCTSHTTTYNTDSKERSVKPAASEGISAGLWKGKGVTGLSVQIKCEGLRFYDEKETSFKALVTAWKAGKPVAVEAFERSEAGGTAPKSYLTGSFVITSLEESAPAQDDSTYSLTLENDGEVTFTEENITVAATEA